jgi:hypothetical protein
LVNVGYTPTALMADSIFSLLSGGVKFDRKKFNKDISTFTQKPQTADASGAQKVRAQQGRQHTQPAALGSKRKREQAKGQDSGGLTAMPVAVCTF